MNNLLNSTEQTVRYSGKVKVYIERKNERKLVSESSNAGGSELFRFFAECAAGNLSTANTLRPTQIKLFCNPEPNYSTAKTAPWNNYAQGWDRSDLIYIDESPKVAKLETENTYSTTLHFRIPYALMKVDSTNHTINQLALYSNANKSGTGDGYSAVYLLHKTVEGATPPEVWDPIDTASYGKNFGLIIEWTLKVENKTTASAV